MKNINLQIKKVSFIFIFAFVQFASFAQSKTFKVTDYGANPNDKYDDSESIQKCINNALITNQDVTIVFPKATTSYNGYRISKTIEVEVSNNHNITLKGDINKYTTIYMTGEASRFPIYCGFLVRSKPEYSGLVTLSGFNIEGKFTNKLQSYIDNATGAKGIFMVNIHKANISKNSFKNIYGDGIWCNGSNSLEPSDNILIENNTFLNVFGLNLTADRYTGGENYDNYGDGISITNLQNVIIRNNIISNNIQVSKSYGRAGIVLEKNTTNCSLINNTINGYDRGIHIEGDKGGHVISDNKISGTNMSIFIYSVKRSEQNPIKIYNNQFIYNNECDTYKLPHLHASYPVFIKIDGNPSEHLVGTEIRNNSFTYSNPKITKRIINDFLDIPKQGGVSWCGNKFYSGKTILELDKACK